MQREAGVRRKTKKKKAMFWIKINRQLNNGPERAHASQTTDELTRVKITQTLDISTKEYLGKWRLRSLKESNN